MGLGRKLARKVHRAASLRLQRDPVTGRAIQSIGRVVTLGDRLGSWTVPDLFLDRDSVVYCVGCGEDVTFDLALIDRFGCTVHAFDPTPRAIDHVAKVAGANPRYKFQPIGLWDSDTTVSFFAPANEAHVSHSIVNLQQTNRTFEAPVRRLKNVMADEGHEKLSLLKLDVEGAEYRILETIVQDRLEISVLCVEFDEYFHPLDSQYKTRIDEHIEMLLGRGYQLVYTSGNANYTFVLQ